MVYSLQLLLSRIWLGGKYKVFFLSRLHRCGKLLAAAKKRIQNTFGRSISDLKFIEKTLQTHRRRGENRRYIIYNNMYTNLLRSAVSF